MDSLLCLHINLLINLSVFMPIPCSLYCFFSVVQLETGDRELGEANRKFQIPGNKRITGPYGDDIRWNPQQRGESTCRNHIQRLGIGSGWKMGALPFSKILTQNCSCWKEIQGQKSRAESEGKAIQRLPHMWIYPICSHQAQALLLMPTNACWEEPDIDVSWEALPNPYWYRCGCLQSTIRMSFGTPM